MDELLVGGVVFGYAFGVGAFFAVVAAVVSKVIDWRRSHG